MDQQDILDILENADKVYYRYKGKYIPATIIGKRVVFLYNEDGNKELHVFYLIELPNKENRDVSAEMLFYPILKSTNSTA